MTAQGSTKNQRLVLYLTPRAMELLGSEADRRTRAAGVEVSAEGAARALVYEGLGLAADGVGDGYPRPPRFDVEVSRALADVFSDLKIPDMAARLRGAMRAHEIEPTTVGQILKAWRLEAR